MTEDQEFDRFVGPCLAAARAEDAHLPEGLAARIIADAAQVQDGWVTAANRQLPAYRMPIWRQFLSVLGGAPVLGGLMAACAAGVWLGLAPPQGLDPLGYVLDTDTTLSVYTEMQATLFPEDGR